MLARIQNDLFDLGADLCRPGDDPNEEGVLRMQPAQVQRLEGEIDGLNVTLSPLNSFVCRVAALPPPICTRHGRWCAGPSA